MSLWHTKLIRLWWAKATRSPASRPAGKVPPQDPPAQHVDPGDSSGQVAVLRHRPLIPVLGGFALGIALDGLLCPPSLSWVAMGVAAILLVVWGVRRGLEDWGHWLLAVLLLVPLGGFYHAVRFRHEPAWHLKNLRWQDPGRYCVRGTVTRGPQLHYRRRPFAPPAEPPGRFWMLRVEAEALAQVSEPWRRTAGGVAVFVGGDRPDLNVGDSIEFFARLSRNRSPTNPGERDLGLAYERAGSYAAASVQSPAALVVLERARWYSSPATALGRLHGVLLARLESLLEWVDAPRRSGLITALLFGQRGALTPSQAELLRESGTLHFLAVSGLHVGIFCLFLTYVLTLTGVSVRPRVLLTILLVWAYVLFTGGHVSAARAGLVLTFVFVAPLLERQGDPLSALAGAALLILVISPQQLFSAGFQLTFVAVWAIICIYPQLGGILWPWEDFLSRVRDPQERTLLTDLWICARSYLLLSCTVWAATAPLLAYHFNGICFLAPLLNLVVWPLVLALLLTCFVLAVGLLLGKLVAAPIAGVALFLSNRIETFLQGASSLPGFGVYLPSPPIWWIGLFFVVVGLWVFRWRARLGHKAFVAAALVLGLTYIWHDAAAGMGRRFTLTVADVGHGQAVLAELPGGETLLFDAGSSRTGAQRAVADMLWQKHIGRINVVVVSHFNVDHCSFIPFLHRRFSIQKVVMPARAHRTDFGKLVISALRGEGMDVRSLREGDELAGGGLHCQVIHPNVRFLTDPGLSENEQSLVLHCTYGDLTFLLPGDIESSALRRLSADYGERLRADVLLMPHHGHHHPGLEGFVAHVSPAIAVVSGDADDCDPETRAMLQERGVPLWTTADDGAVILRVRGDVVRVIGHKSGRSMEFQPVATERKRYALQVGERSRGD